MSPGLRRSVGAFAAVLAVGIAALVAIHVAGNSVDPGGSPSEAGPCEATDRDDDFNRQVGLTAIGEWIEFELWSSEPFPTRALFPVVRIGLRDFSRSSYGPDGSLNTLIFFIPREEFDLLSPDDPVWVYYGGAGRPPHLDYLPDAANPWSFGSFRKGLVDCPAPQGSQVPTEPLRV